MCCQAACFVLHTRWIIAGSRSQHWMPNPISVERENSVPHHREYQAGSAPFFFLLSCCLLITVDFSSPGFLYSGWLFKYIRSNINSCSGDSSCITLPISGSLSIVERFHHSHGPIKLALRLDPIQIISTFLANEIGYGDSITIEQLSCMRNESSTDIEAFLESCESNGSQPSLYHAPFMDGRTGIETFLREPS